MRLICPIETPEDSVSRATWGEWRESAKHYTSRGMIFRPGRSHVWIWTFAVTSRFIAVSKSDGGTRLSTMVDSAGLIVPVDDERLAAKVRAGDREAFATVVHTYLPQILRAARGAGLAPEDAEDVAQSTFETFMEVAHRFEGRSQVRTFLFGILYKKVAEARRKSGKAQRFDSIDDVVEGRFDANGGWQRPPRPIDLQLQDAEARDSIEDCLEGVPMQQRMAFVLREVEGLDSAEICKILDVSRTNLGVLMYRARNRLRECLEEKGFRGTSCRPARS